jgi:hypothetical protein
VLARASHRDVSDGHDGKVPDRLEIKTVV